MENQLTFPIEYTPRIVNRMSFVTDTYPADE